MNSNPSTAQTPSGRRRPPDSGAPAPLTRIRTAIGVAWLLFWTLMVLVAVQDYLRDHGQRLWEPVLWETSSMLAATVLLLLQRRLTRRYDTWLATPLRWFALRAALLPLFCGAFVPIAFGLRHAVYALVGARYLHEGWGDTYLYESLKLTVFVSMFTLIEFGILSYLALTQEKLRASAASALLRQAQLSHLSRQMQPHFLFNALNTISSLMHTDVEKADAVLIQLSDVLRASLELGTAHQAALATELALARAYARVMQARYEERAVIAWHIEDEGKPDGAGLMNCLVPVMCLQPLLENVFKHTVERRRDPVHIAVSARIEGAELVLSVEDDSGVLAGSTSTSSGASANGGIGLANLRERAATLYGEAAELSLRQRDPAGVRAELRLPCAS